MSEGKTREELERELKTAEDELDEVDDTLAPHASAGVRMAILGQTGVHIGAKELQKHYARFDSDQKCLNERIVQIKAPLAALATNASYLQPVVSAVASSTARFNGPPSASA